MLTHDAVQAARKRLAFARENVSPLHANCTDANSLLFDQLPACNMTIPLRVLSMKMRMNARNICTSRTSSTYSFLSRFSCMNFHLDDSTSKVDPVSNYEAIPFDTRPFLYVSIHFRRWSAKKKKRK